MRAPSKSLLPGLITGLGLSALSVSAAIVWTEGANGDLSNNRLAPTQLQLSPGPNSVIGSVVGGNVDYFYFTLPESFSFTELNLAAYSGGGDLSFLAIQKGTQFTEPTSGTNPANLLGYTHLSGSMVGADILDNLGTGAGAIGFTPPQPGDSYVFWLQQAGGTPTSYQLDFVVVPEPAAMGLGAVALLSAIVRRRRVAA